MRKPHRLLSILVAAAAVLAVAGASGCKKGSSHSNSNPFDLGRAVGGVVVADFQTLQDFLDHPTVQLLLANMNFWDGDTPPNVAGTYDAFGGIADTTFPGSEIGDPVVAAFCFGLVAAGVLDVRVLDTTITERAAVSFITGSGDHFTVFTVFRSTQENPGGGFCDIIEVNIFSGELAADGSIANLQIGIGVVGLIGNCFPFLIDDAQISQLAAELVGPPCEDAPAGPGDADNVQVVIDNFLLSDVLVFDDPDPAANAAAEVAALGSGSFETAPGFLLDFEAIRPSAGVDDDGEELLMGEIVAGEFDQDATPAGGTVTYNIENVVGNIEFFAPRPLNSTGADIYSIVNSAVPALDFFPYEEPFGSGLDCLCVMPPDPDPYDIGYYSHDAPEISPEQANVRFFNVDGAGLAVAQFFGPFVLANGSGAVVLEVE